MKRVRPTQLADPAAAFAGWFGDSQVVDADGRPRVVYHGTRAAFQRFKRAMLGTNVDNPTTALGFYFTDTPSGADRWASYQAAGVCGQHVMPVFLRIARPRAVEHALFQYFLRRAPAYEVNQLRRETLARGFDGFKISYHDETWWVAFRPEQIKSAIGNRGTYRPTAVDILASRQEGSPVAQPFSEWFGRSHVVDGQGQPLVVFHGTHREVREFAPQKTVRAPLSELGFYFTPDPALAAQFTKRRWASARSKMRDGANVMAVYLSLQNPKRLDAYSWMQHSNRREQVRELRAHLEAQGYDGVIVEALEHDPTGELHVPQYVAFRPDQVRSVFERAEWPGPAPMSAESEPAVIRQRDRG